VIKDGRVYAVVMIVLILFFSWALTRFFNGMLTVGTESFASNKTYSIGIGGAYGILMLLNVWGIIWPNNKRILAATAGTGPAAPPELARQAFIASRTNAVVIASDVVVHGHVSWRLGNLREVEDSDSDLKLSPITNLEHPNLKRIADLSF
jgi:hypothetical protein